MGPFNCTWSLTAAAALAALSTIPNPTVNATPVGVTGSNFSWSNIQPSLKLQWTPCFDQFSCAQLQVPLDYNDESAGTTNVAFMQLAAENNQSSAQSIIVNGGGPGAGLGFLWNNVDAFRTLFGPQYNIIGMDPRGINNSGPVVDCFGPEHPDARVSFQEDMVREVVDASNTSLATQYETSKIMGAWCSQAFQTNTSMKYITTPLVAQDLLTYFQAEAALKGTSVDEVKVWYYGISYGTVIGTTFSSLFPQNVGRVIVDGVVDAEEYYKHSWNNDVTDADAAVQSFATYCHAAGPENCSFWGPDAQNITNRIDNVLASLKEEPLASSGLDGSTTGLATYSDAKELITSALYTPRDMFPVMAGVFALLEAGNGSAIADIWQTLIGLPDAIWLIICLDGYGVTNYTSVEEYAVPVMEVIQDSKYIGDAWTIRAGAATCSFMDVDLPRNGSFPGSLPPSADNTSFPLLFASSIFDPVTPLKNAMKMQQAFPGSSLLIQNATGHTGSYSASGCFIQNIHAYLDGTLPMGTNVTCAQDVLPFQGATGFLTEG